MTTTNETKTAGPPDFMPTPLDRALQAAVRIGVDLRNLRDNWPDGLPELERRAADAMVPWIARLAGMIRAKLAGEGGDHQTSAPSISPSKTGVTGVIEAEKAGPGTEAAPVLEWQEEDEGWSWVAKSELPSEWFQSNGYWEISRLSHGPWSLHKTSLQLTGFDKQNQLVWPTFTRADAAKSWCESRELALRAKRDADARREAPCPK